MAALNNNSLVIAGMGGSGVAVSNFLYSVGIEHVCCDDAKSHADCVDVLKGRQEYVVKSPGVPSGKLPSCIIGSVINDIELFLRLSRKPVIMVTGTNGKSTVVALIENLLNACGLRSVACGNNGVPVMRAYGDEIDVYILELSSYQLESISSFSSLGSVVLNIGVDHTDRYRDMDEYESMKRKVYTSAAVSVFPICEDGKVSYHGNACAYAAMTPESLVKYSLAPNAIYRNNEIYCALSEIGLIGGHNYLNICAALGLIDIFEFEKQAILPVLKSFTGLPHRMELVCEDGRGRKWINDSKSTNVHSLQAALSSQSASVCLIMGGRGKGENYTYVLNDYKHIIGKLVVYGEEAASIFSQALPVRRKLLVETVRDAVIAANEYQGNVLFSPACASLDQYGSFTERGDDFKSQVRRVVEC